MKILHVITSLRTGGAEMLVSKLARLTIAAGHEVEIAVLDATPTPLLHAVRSAGVRVHELGSGIIDVYNPLNIGRLRELISEGGYDIVHSHNSSPQIFVPLAVKDLQDKAPALVTTEHNTDNRRRHLWPLRKLDCRIYDRYDATVCCSLPVKCSLLKAYNGQIEPTKVAVIPNGIDLTPFLNIKRSGKKENFNILMVSAFRKQKDHYTLLAALRILDRRHRLTLAGSGSLMSKTRRQAEALDVADRVTFLGDVSDIPALYAEADVSVLSTHYEGLSLSSVEAMASGVPLVATDVTGVTETVGQGGILVPENQPKPLAQAISMLTSSPDYALEMGRRGREQSMNFDINKTVNQYINLYKAISSR